ncbi:MAG: ABC transporter permease, partial [Bacteroidota bacterium]
MSLLASLRSETLKAKRTAAIYVTIIAAVFAPFMTMLDAVFGEGVLADGGATTIFNRMMTDKFEITGVAMFPLFIILICTLLAQVEYRNNTWKQLLSSPQKKVNVFLSKFITTHLFLITFLVINLL